MIVEAKPIKANKGNFLRQQMRQRGFSKISNVYTFLRTAL